VSYGKKQQSGSEQGATSIEGCANSKGVRLQRESIGSEGELVVQRKSTFNFKWERGVFQNCQEGVMG
jgi:hypothetical protein